MPTTTLIYVLDNGSQITRTWDDAAADPRAIDALHYLKAQGLADKRVTVGVNTTYTTLGRLSRNVRAEARAIIEAVPT